jgi:hypothetical protein
MRWWVCSKAHRLSHAALQRFAAPMIMEIRHSGSLHNANINSEVPAPNENGKGGK